MHDHWIFKYRVFINLLNGLLGNFTYDQNVSLFFSSSELSDGWAESQCAQCRGCHLLLNGPIEWCATKHTEACGIKAVAAGSGSGKNCLFLKPISTSNTFTQSSLRTLRLPYWKAYLGYVYLYKFFNAVNLCV
jgi:hypothetical protein